MWVGADVKAWVASGYHTLAASTTRFLVRVEAVEGKGTNAKKESSEEAILRMLRPYEGSSEMHTAKSIARLENQTSEWLVKVFAVALSKLTVALGVSKS